jgi:serine/threonine-protein kinase
MNCPACDHVNVEGARYCAKCGALMPVAHIDGNDPLVGSIVGGRYRITGLIGEGGMGRVYMGEQQMGTAVRKVAVKTLLQEFSRDPQVVARFMRECGTVVELEHPNTIKFYDFGQTNQGDLYIAMEFVDGQPLSAVIETEGAMGFGRVDNIMKQIAGSLHEAHEKGVVHRDLKPENVILTRRAGESDFVKVLDFGIAKRHDAADTAREQKLTQAGMVLGTPPYMSPEQFTGKELDRRSDIYSLGVMAYEMLTGRLPFTANTPWEWATQHMTQQPFPFDQTGPMAAQIPPHMKQAIMRALSKDRDQRQATSKQFYEELGAGGIGRPSATDLGTGAGPTEAFPAAPAAGAQAPMRTQMGAPFVSPTEPGGGPPMQHQYVPTAGGQAVPTPPPQMHGRGGGGGKGLYIGLAGLVAAGLVVGLVYALSGGGNDETDEPPILSSSTPSSDTATTSQTTTPPDPTTTEGTGGTAPTNTTTPSSTGKPPQPPTQPKPTPDPEPKGGEQGTAACDAAIAAALAGKCGAARSAMGRCSGPKKHIAAANIARCKGR